MLFGRAVPRSRKPFPIQSVPAPTAMSVGVEPVLKVRTREGSFGSIRETVRSSASSTQTLPAPVAMLRGASPSGTVASGSPVLGSSARAYPPAIAASPPSTGSAPPSRIS